MPPRSAGGSPALLSMGARRGEKHASRVRSEGISKRTQSSLVVSAAAEQIVGRAAGACFST